MNRRRSLGPEELVAALQGGDEATLRAYLKAGLLRPDTMLGGSPPLGHALRGHHVATVELLLDAGARLEQRYNGWTALGHTLREWETSEGARALVALLLQRGADVEATSEFGWSPLGFAVDRDDADLVRLLLEHGANASALLAVGSESCTPMQYAQRHGKTEAAAALAAHASRKAGAPPPTPRLSVADVVEHLLETRAGGTGRPQPVPVAPVMDIRKRAPSPLPPAISSKGRLLDGSGTRRPGNHWSPEDLRALSSALDRFVQGKPFDVEYVYRLMPEHSVMTLNRHLNIYKKQCPSLEKVQLRDLK